MTGCVCVAGNYSVEGQASWNWCWGEYKNFRSCSENCRAGNLLTYIYTSMAVNLVQWINSRPTIQWIRKEGFNEIMPQTAPIIRVWYQRTHISGTRKMVNTWYVSALFQGSVPGMKPAMCGHAARGSSFTLPYPWSLGTERCLTCNVLGGMMTLS